MNSASNAPSAAEQLKNLRPLLLALHKSLMEHEKANYEAKFGPIPSRGAYFRLVVDHEWFSWLREISQMIVQIDEALATKPMPPTPELSHLIEKVRNMMQPDDNGTLLEHRYDRAIQREPDIALMHAQLLRLLRPEASAS